MAHDISPPSPVDGEAAHSSSARPPSSIEKETRLVRMARDQHGVVSRRQALEVGLSSSTIRRRIRTGVWTRLLRGTYRIGAVETSLEWASAACLVVEGAVLSHTSAAFLHGWSGSTRPSTTHLSVVGRQHRSRTGLVVHRATDLHADEVVFVSGFPVTAAARTLLDIATMLPSRDIERIVAQLLREEEVLSAAQLHAFSRRYSRRAGIRKLRDVLTQEGGPRFTRSEAEVRFLELMRQAELPLPRTNARVGPFELDAVWPRERVVVEIDGYRYHRSRDRFEADRRKDAWLTAHGYRVIRITWRQLTDRPTRSAVQIGRALAEATKTR